MEPISQNTTKDAYLGAMSVLEIRKGPALIWKRPDAVSYEYEFTASRNAIEASAIPGDDYFTITSNKKTYVNGVFVKAEPLGFTVEKNRAFYARIDGNKVTISWGYNDSDGVIATSINLTQADSNVKLSLDFVQEYIPVCRVKADAGGATAYAVSNKPVASDVRIGLEITTYDNPDGSSETWYDTMVIPKGQTECRYNVPNSDIVLAGSIFPEYDDTYIYVLS